MLLKAPRSAHGRSGTRGGSHNQQARILGKNDFAETLETVLRPSLLRGATVTILSAPTALFLQPSRGALATLCCLDAYSQGLDAAL